MRLTIKRWGNTAAIRLTEELLNQLGLSIGDIVDVNLEQGVITLSAESPKYKLVYLLAEMSDGLPIEKVWEQMPPVGNEIIKY